MVVLNGPVESTSSLLGMRGSWILYPDSTSQTWKRRVGHQSPVMWGQPHHSPFVGKLLRDQGWTWDLHLFAKLTPKAETEQVYVIETLAGSLTKTLCHSQVYEAVELANELRDWDLEFLAPGVTAQLRRTNCERPIQSNGSSKW